MLVDVTKLYMSEQVIKKRLVYIRGQIKKCEGEIPSKFWCKDCKRRIKKIKYLLDKLAERIRANHLTSKHRRGDPSEFYDYEDHRTKRGFIGPDEKTDYDFYGIAYVCVDCRAESPSTHMVYDRKEDLVHDNFTGKWRCPVCDSDKIVVLKYSSKAGGCIERNLNDDSSVSTTSNLYPYVCLDCGAEYKRKEDLGKTWKLDKNEWTCTKCFSTNIVNVDIDGGEQGLNGRLK